MYTGMCVIWGVYVSLQYIIYTKNKTLSLYFTGAGT